MRTDLHRPSRAALLTLAAFTTLLLAHAVARAETYWLDGYEVEVTLRPERDSYLLGEPVTLMLTFKGRSDAELELLLSGEKDGEGWPDDFSVTVTDPDGNQLPRPDGVHDEKSYTNTVLRGSR